ncbi:hydantoinase/oxoprolinase family protein [Nocardia jiangxiensis]|uniref:Hydantoinase/oxoprolinase family protein n=1 Tax=Nocardia jiangxiensis TaxID=282685 RepID=A0ABW6RYN5_9NOCA
MSSEEERGGSGYALGVDVGGTFTDVVLAGPDGQESVAKTLSTHGDPTDGILNGIRAALDAAGVRPDQVDRVVHATTLATNAILENKGVRVAHVVTQGFRSLLPLGRYARVEEDRFDLMFTPPASPVPLEDCFEVPERIDAAGEVVTALDESAVAEIADRIAERGIASVSVALVHAYANPGHEQRVVEIIRERLGAEATVVGSAEIWPEIREYERSTTTLMSAYVGPLMVRYLRVLESRLAELGIRAKVQVMESGGAVMSAELAGRRAVATVESGPAAGAVAASFTGLSAGRPDVISFDMGGTTAKACVIRDGKPDITTEFHVGGKGSYGGRRAGTGVPIKVPAIDLAEVGAGGGSIAWVDDAGALHVGPRSAGSEPGPACYGLGGAEPTVTDANLVLGLLDPALFAGGEMALSPELAEKAIADRLARPLGVTVAEAAHAVHEIANATMGSAVHVVTVQRGIDPRDFALVASGGAGPMHAARVAERFDIDTVIVPPSCGVGSAVGLLATDLSVNSVATRVLSATGSSLSEVTTIFDELVTRALHELGGAPGDSDVTIARAVDLRFVGQAHQIRVELPGWPLTDEVLAALVEQFCEQYRAQYGIELRDPAEMVTYRAQVSRLVPKVPLGRRAAATSASNQHPDRQVWFAEYAEYRPVPVYDRDQLSPGAELAGPLIVDDRESTVVVPPTWNATIDNSANIVLTRKENR